MAISSPSGDVGGAEEAIALCAALLPEQAQRASGCRARRTGSAPDLVATVSGTGSGRMLLLGHVDTVIAHDSHAPLRRDGERLYGPGTADMKGGVVLSLGRRAGAGRATRDVRRARGAARHRRGVADVSVRPRAAVRRLRRVPVLRGRAADVRAATRPWSCAARRPGRCGSARPGAPRTRAALPTRAATRCWAWPRTALELAGHHDPAGPEHLSVVPTVMRSGDAFNVVPAAGRAAVRHARRPAGRVRRRARRRSRPSVDGVALEAGDGAAVAGDGRDRDHRARCSSAPGAAGPPDRRCRARRRQRRQPLRRGRSRSRSTGSARAAAAPTRRRSSCSSRALRRAGRGGAGGRRSKRSDMNS